MIHSDSDLQNIAYRMINYGLFEEEDIDPLEPTEDETIENSSNNQETSVTQTQEEETLDPGIDNLGTYSP